MTTFLLAEAVAAPFEGWDFAWIADRQSLGSLPWDYGSIVEASASQARTMLDLGTGGGEFLSSLNRLPRLTVATEGYRPNWAVAARRLSEHGVHVVAVGECPDNNRWRGEGGALPFSSGAFDLVTNRHEAYSPTEVARVLAPTGLFVTQQVGGRDESELLAWFDRPFESGPEWNLEVARGQLEAAGFVVVGGDESFPRRTSSDVGALTHYLLAIPWRMQGFDVEADRDHLERLHARINQSQVPLSMTSHRFWLAARRASQDPRLQTCQVRQRCRPSTA